MIYRQITICPTGVGHFSLTKLLDHGDLSTIATDSYNGCCFSCNGCFCEVQRSSNEELHNKLLILPLPSRVSRVARLCTGGMLPNYVFGDFFREPPGLTTQSKARNPWNGGAVLVVGQGYPSPASQILRFNRFSTCAETRLDCTEFILCNVSCQIFASTYTQMPHRPHTVSTPACSFGRAHGRGACCRC